MKVLLRSTFLARPTDKPEYHFENFLKLFESGLQFEFPEDKAIWNYIKDFSREQSHVPDIRTIRSYLEKERQTEILDRLEILAQEHPLSRGDFIRRLEDKTETRKSRDVQEILKEAAQILSMGVEIREGRDTKTLKGPRDAVRYFLDRSGDIIAPALGGRLEGEFTADGERLKERYERVEADPQSGLGRFTGIQQIDLALRGAKRNELWTHAAFTGGLKSSFMLTWAYNLAMHMGYDSLVFSLEMPLIQVENLLLAMHSLHPCFLGIRQELGIQEGDTLKGVPYNVIRDGEMTPAQKKLIYDYVVPDMNNREEKGYGKIHIKVSDPDSHEFTVLDLRQKATTLYSHSPFDIIFVDHVGLMSPRRWVPSTSDRLNEVFRDLKRLAMSFNRGQGIPVVALYQINREGYKSALKNEGRYNLTHLSYANECERSSDIVTTTWIDDELRKEARVQYQCLKSRDQQPFEMFKARVHWDCRKIMTCWEVPIINADLDNIDDLLNDEAA